MAKRFYLQMRCVCVIQLELHTEKSRKTPKRLVSLAMSRYSGSAHERNNCVHNRILSALPCSKGRALFLFFFACPSFSLSPLSSAAFARSPKTVRTHFSATKLMYRLIHCIHSFAAFHHFSISAFMFN